MREGPEDVDLKSSGRLLAVLAAGTLAMTACGNDGVAAGTQPSTAPTTATTTAPTTTTGTAALVKSLSGAGSSAQSAAMKAWAAGFKDATINYDPVGSSGGREQFIAGGEIKFAGSDSAMKDEELTKGAATCGSDVLDIPLYVSPIAVVYNLEGVEDLQLSAATVAKIFNQKITTWDDAAIKADNPGVDLPSTAITPVNRSDGSGTTNNFTDYLAKAATADWPYPASSDFPVKGGEAANGTSGVVAAVAEADGGIGYADESQAGELSVAKLKVGEAFVAPTAELAAQVVGASPVKTGRKANDLALDINRTATTGYPVVLVTYSVVCSKYADAAVGATVKAFLTYVASDAGQQAAAAAAGSAPLAGELKTKVDTAITSIS
jgi:phosphate transport system substrate-binding protein